ncbi:hypothetical protein [Methyloversatilis sp.]|uniref:hypothetical protein n=1 Tax=Methyloversatilis sp. TaxID=2569862 RepID=UPI0027350DEB|nr:hypothetical protein [Methyloversatilis sp.]MDP2867532.1 hypothetical protein [Methyloversatilis sp.]MDP3453954.1 hypothetical protein [Methyloversatilis sp.]MDP3578108.1 hypothetical protein [Methyloversatilis sp.]
MQRLHAGALAGVRRAATRQHPLFRQAGNGFKPARRESISLACIDGYRGGRMALSRFPMSGRAGICAVSEHSEKQFPKESSFRTVIDKEFVVLT